MSETGAMEKDPKRMNDLAADHFESLVKKVNNVVRPHPYLDDRPHRSITMPKKSDQQT